jgi:hypothetical protein
MSGDPNVLYDGNHLDVLRRHVRDESIDLVYGVSSDPWWQEVMERAPGRQRPGDAAGRSDDGSCRDGLGPDGVNGNMGAESTLAWLVAVERMRALHNEASAQPAKLIAGGAGGVGSGLGRTRVTRLGAR